MSRPPDEDRHLPRYGTIVCKQEVADQRFLYFGVGFQSPQIKEAPVSSVADRGASTGLGERRRQHLSKQ